MSYDQTIARKQFLEHGEVWIQEKLKGRLSTILDVGSNIGEWTRMAREFNPAAQIHMFEIVPDTYCRLLNNIKIDSNTIPNGFGLGDTMGMVEVQYPVNNPELSTQYKKLILENSVIRHGLMMTGDQYVQSRNLNQIDYLKIDVEGAEGLVFKGFENTLKSRKIKIIQFEYSYHAILGRWLLVDSYELLSPLGYYLGRLTPQGIEFHQYTYRYELFGGHDYVAVHESAMHLVN